MSTMNTINLGEFQNLIGNNKPTSMCDLIAAVRILKENVRYVSKILNDETEDKDLYLQVNKHLQQDIDFIELTMKGQIALRVQDAEKRKADIDKQFNEQEFEEVKKE